MYLLKQIACFRFSSRIWFNIGKIIVNINLTKDNIPDGLAVASFPIVKTSAWWGSTPGSNL